MKIFSHHKIFALNNITYKKEKKKKHKSNKQNFIMNKF